MYLNLPFPLIDRIMVHWKYLNHHRNPDERILIMTEEVNEDILAKHLTPVLRVPGFNRSARTTNDKVAGSTGIQFLPQLSSVPLRLLVFTTRLTRASFAFRKSFRAFSTPHSTTHDRRDDTT
jgi:hypothetical protein